MAYLWTQLIIIIKKFCKAYTYIIYVYLLFVHNQKGQTFITNYHLLGIIIININNFR